MVPLALGTQTGGSVIRPAAYCGVYGYKASIDALDRGGIRHLRPSLDSLGVFARSLEEISYVCGQSVSLERSARLGFCRTHEWHLAKPETREAVLGAAQKLGATEVELPQLFAEALESFRIIVLRESALAYALEFRDHLDTLNDYGKALAHAAECRNFLETVFREVDAIITPATAGEASQKLTGLEDQTFCPLWSLMQGPCITIPAFKGPNGMPMGLQLVGPVNGDGKLLAVASWVDSLLGSHHARV
jgi:Asp-tRNA(Asn)/Glu-tRNA(Gln) amidotransferase A subunit family amidase